MKFIILSREAAEATGNGLTALEYMTGRLHYLEEPYIFISITDIGSKNAGIPSTHLLKGIHRVKFHDTDCHDATFLGKPLIPINDKQAMRIWKFFKSFKDSVSICIVHCEAGICRSAGCAAALAKAIGDDDERFFKTWTPNRLVYRKVLNAAMSDMQSEEDAVQSDA